MNTDGLYKVISQKRKLVEFQNGSKRDFKLHFELEMQKKYGFNWKKKVKQHSIQMEGEDDVQSNAG